MARPRGFAQGDNVRSTTQTMAEQADPAAGEAALRERIILAGRDLATLLVLWHQRHEPGLGWVESPQIHALLSRAFIEVGAPLLGLEVAVEGLEISARDVALRQLQGLALARSGSTEEANQVLDELRAEGHLDDQTLGVLARTHKDLGLYAGGEERRRHIEAARRLYGDAFALSGSYWTGINVATLAALLGEREHSRDIAGTVARRCHAELERLPAVHPDRYWVLATLGEAALVRGELTAAEDWYRQAVAIGRRRFGDVNSTRRHARLLLEHLGRDPGEANDWLALPRVVVFSGHMIDGPGRETERFPARLEAAVKSAIREWLAGQGALVGFSSGACGSDILFQEALEQLDGERHVVLPYGPEDFIRDSVEIGVGGEWRRRFDHLLESARVVYASASRPPSPAMAYDYANRLVHGLGLVRARELETGLLGLSVWDGRPGDGLGGAASAVAQWQAHGVEVHCVELAAALAAGGAPLPVRPVCRRAPSDDRLLQGGIGEDGVMALLFADAVGYSQLTEAEVPLFVDSCLGLVARLIERHAVAVPVRETWGDGLFLAFHKVRDAGVFALDLLDRMGNTDWRALGFTRPLTMRFALHAGPVRMTVDPVTSLPKCCGTHVSRAARLEPKTPPGQVYASEAFAALAAVEEVAEFRCDYVKELTWAKRYGTFPAYVVRRAVGAASAVTWNRG